MREELDRQLVAAFPLLYRNRYSHVTPRPLIAWFGFECEDGWFDLIWELSSLLERYIAALAPDERAVTAAAQVKEKFGGLRFYMDGYVTQVMDAAIDQAVAASFHICEICGNLGLLVQNGRWYLVRCSVHNEHAYPAVVPT
jgi:hypothetical protein